MTQDAQVIVVGGGIVGICSALSLAERGVSVCLVDRDAPGQGASMGNAGVISPFSVVPQSLPGLWKNIPRWLLDPLGPVAVRPAYLPRFLPWALRFLSRGTEAQVRSTSAAMDRLNHDNVHLYRRLLQGTGHEGLVKDSAYVFAYRDGGKARLDTLENDLRRLSGARLDRVDASELRRLEPALSSDYRAAIIMGGQARATSPGMICAALAEKFRGLGGRIEQAEVQALRRTGEGWSVKTASGVMLASQVVLAAGAWSMRLLAPLGLRLPLEAERGYHALFRDPAITLDNSVMDMDMKFVASSMDMGLRAAGTAEFAGLDSPPNPKRFAALKANARRMCPDLRADTVEAWSGIRPSFPDSLPVIGELPGLAGLIGAFGHSHWGFMMGPRTGQIVADLVTGRTPNCDLTPYGAARFGKKA